MRVALHRERECTAHTHGAFFRVTRNPTPAAQFLWNPFHADIRR